MAAAAEHVYSPAMFAVNRASDRLNALEEELAAIREDIENLLTSLRPAMPDDETDEYWKRFYEIASEAVA